MANFTDLTKPVDLLHHAKGTGHKRLQKPVYTDFMPPCNSACPAGENIQAWLDHAQAGDYEKAFQQIVEDNPFPAVMGRICVKPCEIGCNRNHIDKTVNIHAVERFVGDLAIQKGWVIPETKVKTGKKVMVIGAGPGGLSAAYHLAKMGHEVEIFEAGDAPGGLLQWGIPEYRLPKHILQSEINRLLAVGIVLHIHYRVEDVLLEKETRGFDAVYLSLGAQKVKDQIPWDHADIPCMGAFEFLSSLNKNRLQPLGKKVVVYGGGKLAMYIARIIKRLGAEPVVLYEGDRKTMQAYDFEADDAADEGVDIQYFHRINSIEGNVLNLEKTAVIKSKIESTGELFTQEADSLVWATGQDFDDTVYKSIQGIESGKDGGLVIDQTRMTGHEGVFAGGDMLTGEQNSTTISIGHGKKAAKYIDAWLKGVSYEKPPKPPTAGYKRLHIWYQTDAPAAVQPRQNPEDAVRNFKEVVAGLNESEARYEAQRCLSCGNCFECDGCFGACPENAIIKLGKGNRYEFNYEACTGCSICFEQCPCHAIEMVPETENGSK